MITDPQELRDQARRLEIGAQELRAAARLYEAGGPRQVVKAKDAVESGRLFALVVARDLSPEPLDLTRDGV